MDLSGQRSMRSQFNAVVHLQNVTKVLPKDCLLTNKDPTEPSQHCQTFFDGSAWNLPVAPRIGNKTLMEVIGDWYFGRSPSPVVRQVGCEYPCNPICKQQSLSH
ncbi:uncharacterized protein [Miscanthus floridulus]|uniref:uncharacterized protein isoform X2 n=1 Tax=Miscanthus floridulus TaxID=154761 RepID=UPI00345B157E